MADKVVVISQQALKPIKLIKWKVNEGNSVSVGCVVLLYEVDGDDKHIISKLKCTQTGTVHKLLAQEGDVVKPGENLLELQPCLHPTVMRDMCAECGADLRKDDITISASVPMVHSVPDLKVSLEQAQKIGKADVDRLLKDRKLVLLVDLDQTLIHTTNDNIPANIKDVYHFQLYGAHSPWYHTRLRPGTHRFLENMSPYFELHICTFGARNYAHMIAMFLDQDGKLFSQRILSRDECFNPTSKTANLKALFPCGDDLVCIIDDREDVWSYAANLIHVKPYHFFQHTGDINAPPGLDKHESDDKEGVDLSKVNNDKDKKLKINGSLDKNTLIENNETNEEPKKTKTIENNESNEKNKNNENSKTVEENGIKENNAEILKENENKDSENAMEVDVETDASVLEKPNLKNKEENDTNLKKNEENETNLKNNEENETNLKNNEENETNLKNNEEDETSLKNNEENETSLKNNEEKDTNLKNEENETSLKNNEEKDTNLKNNEENETNLKNNLDKVPIVEVNEKIEDIVEEKQTKSKDNDTTETTTQKIEEMNELSKENNIALNNGNEDNKSELHNSFKQFNNINKENELKEEELVEIEDSDDYLLYLEHILKVIHKTFYDKYDKMESGKVPDLKKVIPEVRRHVLKGTKLAFSGLVPTHIKLEQSKAYQVAKSLGATITQDLEETTTHLVAVRPGTAKVNAGRRRKNLKIVTPDWLWACAERWDKVEEKLYTLNNTGSKNRHPPPHCSSPEHISNFEDLPETSTRKRTPSGRFMDTINPLMSFSSADIADMDREVEDIFNESESEGESSKKVERDNDEVFIQEFKKDKESDDSSSSSEESLTGEHPHGWRPNKTENKRRRSRDDDLEDESTADEFPSTKFRRGEELSSDLDIGQDSNSEGSVDAPDEIDDGDWNMMGAALEREFLANN